MNEGFRTSGFRAVVDGRVPGNLFLSREVLRGEGLRARA